MIRSVLGLITIGISLASFMAFGNLIFLPFIGLGILLLAQGKPIE